MFRIIHSMTPCVYPLIFSIAHAGVGTKFRSKLKMAILTMISYHDVAFSFDSEFLTDVLTECQVGVFCPLCVYVCMHLCVCVCVCVMVKI